MKNKCLFIAVFALTCASYSFSQGIKYTKNDTIRYIVKNEIPRFFSGTLWTGIEYPLKNKKSIYVSGIATYGSNFSSNRQLIGWGGEFQYRSYLGKGDFVTNYPIYLAGQLMFRRLNDYSVSENGQFVNDVWISTQTESKSSYNVYYAGILLGCQVFVNQVFTLDLNFGGGLRLSQIDGEKSFTKYKNLSSLNYSGVMPRLGLVIGIIQH